MSKIFLRILQVAKKDPTSKHIEYLINALRRNVDVGIIEENKEDLVAVAVKASEMSYQLQALEVLRIINSKLSKSRYTMLNLTALLINFGLIDEAAGLAKEIYDDSTSNFEKMQALDMLIKAQSRLACPWQEIEKMVQELREVVEAYLGTVETVKRGELVMLLACCYWFAGYFNDDLDDLKLTQRISSLVQDKIDKCL